MIDYQVEAKGNRSGRGRPPRAGNRRKFPFGAGKSVKPAFISMRNIHYPTVFHHEYHEWTNDTNFSKRSAGASNRGIFRRDWGIRGFF
jgi:hypothetical protein